MDKKFGSHSKGLEEREPGLETKQSPCEWRKKVNK